MESKYKCNSCGAGHTLYYEVHGQYRVYENVQPQLKHFGPNIPEECPKCGSKDVEVELTEEKNE